MAIPQSTYTPITIEQILASDRVLFMPEVNSKKKALELVGTTVSDSLPYLDCNEIFDALVIRERLGSTAIGHGVALPHCRLAKAREVIGSFILLKSSIDFDAPDKLPINMLFSLIVPEQENKQYLDLLALIAEKFKTESFRNNLSLARSKQELLNLLIS